MTSEDKIEKVFDTDILRDEKFLSIIKEIVRDLEKRSDIPAGMIAQEIKVKYKITDHPLIDLEKNLWTQCTKDIQNFEGVIQGHRIATKPNGKVKIPILNYCVDVEQGEKIIKEIVNNYNKLQK